MPDNGWLTLGGTALGGLIAAGSAWLNAHLQSRRERVKDNLQYRRQTYADYWQKSSDLYSAFHDIYRDQFIGKGSASVLGSQEQRSAISARFEKYAQAAATMTILAGPEVAKQAQFMTVRHEQARRAYDSLATSPPQTDEFAEALELFKGQVELTYAAGPSMRRAIREDLER